MPLALSVSAVLQALTLGYEDWQAVKAGLTAVDELYANCGDWERKTCLKSSQASCLMVTRDPAESPA